MRVLAFVCTVSVLLSSCATYSPSQDRTVPPDAKKMTSSEPRADYSSRIPSHIATHEKVIVINPNVHVWGAYGADGNLIRAGLTSAGSDWCADIQRRCRTKPGSFRIQSLGAASCKSTLYPLPHGGAPMPYCMFFNGSQGMHGSYAVVEGNISHGCVRMHVADAEWIRFNFANIGTKVIVKPY